MVRFGSGMSEAATAAEAARTAVERAVVALGDVRPKLAIVFLSVGYPDVEATPLALRRVLGPDVTIVGGTAGGAVFASDGCTSRGISVVLLGGELEVVKRSAATSPDMLAAVPAAEDIAREAVNAAQRGLDEHACLVFAPGLFADGEAVVAAVRKGAGMGMQLAGALTGDDFTMDRPAVLDEDRLVAERVVLVGLYTKTRVGIAARHGWRELGPERTVTRAEGPLLVEIDGRPALDVWLEDAARARMATPTDRRELLLHLANHFPLGLVDEPSGSFRARTPGVAPQNGGPPPSEEEATRELVARTPFAIRDGGAVQLSASVPENTRIRVLCGTRNDLLRASRDAARTATLRAGGKLSGALVLACSGRLAALGDAFPEEPAQVAASLGTSFAGACVFGEIARNVRDLDAFFNVTVVVVAFGTS